LPIALSTIVEADQLISFRKWGVLLEWHHQELSISIRYTEKFAQGQAVTILRFTLLNLKSHKNTPKRMGLYTV